MPTLPVAEWLPDQPDFNNPGCTVARSVYPRSLTSYGPIPSLNAIGYPALPSQPFGLYSYNDRVGTGNTHIFTGTATKLYHLSTGLSAFADVTKVAATYAASFDNPWSMTAFGNTVIATNGADPPQLFTIGAANFVDLGGSPPTGRYGMTVRDFLMLGNVTEGGITYPQRVHWSAIGDPGTWPTLGTSNAAQLQSDAQDLRADLGHIRGLASGLQAADVAVFMDRAVYSGTYVGSPAIFSFTIAQGATGCRLQNSIISIHGQAFYLGTDGFYSFDGVTPHRIGAQKIDRWFFNDPVDGVNLSFANRIQGAASPENRLVMWIYCSAQSTGTPNRLLIYNYELERWSMARLDAVWLGRGLTTGYSLDQLDTFGNMETLPFSLDSDFWSGGNPVLMGFTTGFQLAAFGGSNLAATVETQEAQPAEGHRCRLTNSRPLVDGGSPTIAIGSRNRLEDAVSYDSAMAMNVHGECPQRTDGRYIRAQVNMPAGATWTHVQGCEIEFAKSTRR